MSWLINSYHFFLGCSTISQYRTHLCLIIGVNINWRFIVPISKKICSFLWCIHPLVAIVFKLNIIKSVLWNPFANFEWAAAHWHDCWLHQWWSEFLDFSFFLDWDYGNGDEKVEIIIRINKGCILEQKVHGNAN